MVQYKSSNLHYPGDEKMRNTTQMKKRKRGTIKVGVIECVCFWPSGYDWVTVSA